MNFCLFKLTLLYFCNSYTNITAKVIPNNKEIQFLLKDENYENFTNDRFSTINIKNQEMNNKKYRVSKMKIFVDMMHITTNFINIVYLYYMVQINNINILFNNSENIQINTQEKILFLSEYYNIMNNIITCFLIYLILHIVNFIYEIQKFVSFLNILSCILMSIVSMYILLLVYKSRNQLKKIKDYIYDRNKIFFSIIIFNMLITLIKNSFFKSKKINKEQNANLYFI